MACIKKILPIMRLAISSAYGLFFELSYLDSNQDKQNQNLLCYHYTIGQSSSASSRKSGAKLVFFIYSCKLFMDFL